MGYLSINGFYKTALILFFASILTSCGGGGSGDGKRKTSPTTECPEENPYCNSKYAELRIKTTDNRIWLTTSGEYSTLQATPQGRPKGGIEFENISSKNLEFWNSSNTSVASIDEDGLITAKSVGEAIITYELEIAEEIKQPATKRIIVKESSTNTPPEAVIDLSQITVDGEQIISIENATITARGGNTVKLSNYGSSDSDGEITVTLWDIPAIINSSDKTEDELTITIPKTKDEQIYPITLEIQDNSGGTSSTQVILKTLPVLPIANSSGSTLNVIEETEISITGESSSFYGINGSAAGLTYNWQQTSEIETYPLLISNPSAESFTIKAPKLLDGHPENGVIIGIKLTVTNELGFSDSTSFEILVQPQGANIAPTLTLKFDTETVAQETPSSTPRANEKTTVCATAIATDIDPGIVSISWTFPEGFSTGDALVETAPTPVETLKSNLCFTLPSQTTISKTYSIQAVTKDGHEETDKQQTTVAELSLKVDPVNAAPIIETSTEEIDNKIRLNITIYDPDPIIKNTDDADGAISKLNIYSSDVAYTWAPGLNLDKNRVITYIEFDKPILKQKDEYTFEITAEDNEGEETSYAEIVPIDDTSLTPTEINIKLSDHDLEEWKLSWKESEYSSQYIVYWRTDKILNSQYNASRAFLINDNSLLLHTFFKDSPDTTYYYKVNAVYPEYKIDDISELGSLEENTENALSNDSQEAIFLPPPKTPYIGNDIREIELHWDSLAGANNYRIECDVKDENGKEAINCPITCNESNTNIVSGTRCTHSKDIKINTFNEETKTVNSYKYNYRIIPTVNNNDGRFATKEGYARANIARDITPGIGPTYYTKFTQYQEKLYSLQWLPSKVISLLEFDPNKNQNRIISLPEYPEEYIGNQAFDKESSTIYAIGTNSEKLYSLDLSGITLSSTNDLSHSIKWKTHYVSNLYGDGGIASNESLTVQNEILWIISPQRGKIQYIDLSQATYKISPEFDLLSFNSHYIIANDYLYSFGTLPESGDEAKAFLRANLDNLIDTHDLSWEVYQIIEDPNNSIEVDINKSCLAFDGNNTIYYRSKYFDDASLHSLEIETETDFKWNYVKTSSNKELKIHENFYMTTYNNSLIIIDKYSQFGYEQYYIDTKDWPTVSQKLDPRSSATSISYKDEIYIMGGFHDGGLSIVQSYNPETGAWANKDSFKTSRTNFPSVIFDDKIYALGNGYDDASTEKFELNTWTSGFDLITTRASSCAVENSGYIYVLGGAIDSDFHKGRFVERYNPACNFGLGCWETLSSESSPKSLMPHQRYQHTCQVHNNEIYVFGGRGIDYFEGVKEIDIYNIESGEWRTSSIRLPENYIGAHNHILRSAKINDTIIIAGGEDTNSGQNPVNNKLIGFQPETETLIIDDTNFLPLLPKHSHKGIEGYTVNSYKGQIYLFGGQFGYGGLSLVTVIY